MDHFIKRRLRSSYGAIGNLVNISFYVLCIILYSCNSKGDYQIYKNHERSRRGGSGTKTLTVRHDGIERITEIELEVTSENDDVKATVIKGGVGKDKVKIEITGKDTEFLEYHIRIFGKP